MSDLHRFIYTYACECDEKCGQIHLPIQMEITGILILSILFAPFCKTGLIFYIGSWVIYEVFIYGKNKFWTYKGRRKKTTYRYPFIRRFFIIILAILAWVIVREIMGYKRFYYCD